MNFRQLKRNCELNLQRSLLPIQTAISASRGRVDFFNDRMSTYTIGGTLDKARAAARGYDALPVRSMSLVDLFESRGIAHCALLKLDCGGAEFEIIRETPDELLDRIDQIVAEIHEIQGQSGAELLTRLQLTGFVVRTEGPLLWAKRP